MADPLKYMFNPSFFEGLCPVLRETIPGFDCRDFIFRVFDNTWPDLELKARVRKISTVLHYLMPAHYPDAARLLVHVSDRIRASQDRGHSFAYIVIPEYIELFGTEFPEESFAALEEITKLVSGEFAIRPFLSRYPDETFAKLRTWSQHPDEAVRRLSSEGCRPHLPWAMGIPALKKDPSSIIPILENLKNDPSLFVRKSVANNLNDIARDHPRLVLDLATAWMGKHEHTDWIIRRGCRSLLKKGDAGALALQGFDPGSRSKVLGLHLPKKKVRIGESMTFGFDFVNQENQPANFRLEYAIDYLTSTGKISRKIFKITENKFPPRIVVAINRKQSFRNFTTRKHFKGRHHLTILANGKKLAAQEFLVC